MILHDLFLRRCPRQLLWGEAPPPRLQTFLVQAAHIVFGDLAPKLGLDVDFFASAHDAMARELGTGRLFDARAYDEICGRFLTEPYDLWNDRHGSPDSFAKARLSLVELLFRAAEERAARPPA